MDEQSYDPIVPVKVGNRRASERSGHGIHWREGGNKGTNLPKGNIVEAQTSVHYVPANRQTNRTDHGSGTGRGVALEEPTAVIPHGGVREGGEPMTPW